LNETEILRRAQGNLSRAISAVSKSNLPPLGSRWQTYSVECQRKIRSFRTPIEAIHFAQLPDSHGGFDCRLVGQEIIAQAEVEDEKLQAMFPAFGNELASFTESPFSHYDSLEWYRDRLVSSDLFKLTRFILRCIETSKPDRVLEIGGGYGAPGRLWLTNSVHNPQLYVDVDLPESLFFVEVWLSLHFGLDEVLYLHDESDLIRYHTNNPSIVLVPPSALDLVKEMDVDIVVNTRSFSEMSSQCCKYYIDWIDASGIDNFYSFNFFGQDLTDLREGMNYYVPDLSRRWHLTHRDVAGQQPYTSAEFVFRCADGPRAAEYDKKLNTLLGRELDQLSYVDAIDAARFVKSGSQLIELIRHAHRSLGFFPKEVVHLASRINSADVSKLTSDDQSLLEEINLLIPSDSKKTRQIANVSPHLIPLRDQLVSFEDLANRHQGFIVEKLGELYLVLDGETVSIGPPMGVVETFKADDYETTLSGWCANNLTGMAGEEVFWFVNDQLLCSFSTDVERPDISMSLQNSRLPVGFHLAIPNAVLPEQVMTRSRFFARAVDNSFGELRR